jgi:predicted secreted protein
MRFAKHLLAAPVAIAIIAWLSQFMLRDGGVGIVNGLVVFIIIWWLVLFMMLPIGVTSQHESGDIVAGTEPGAPTRPMLAQKAWWTTSIASVFWLIYFGITESGLLNAWFLGVRSYS